MVKNIVLVYTCMALIIREINTCNVPTYEEFNVIIFNDFNVYGHMTQIASIVGLRDVVGKTVKMVKYGGVDDDIVETVVRRVKAEAP